MSYCSDKQYGYVYFKYPGEGQKRYWSKFPPIGYTTEAVEPKFKGGWCYGRYRIYVDAISSSMRFSHTPCGTPVTLYSSFYYSGKIIDIDFQPLINNQPIRPIITYEKSNGAIVIEERDAFYRAGNVITFYHTQCQGSRASNFHANTLSNLRAVPDSNTPSECGDSPSQCKFAIADARGEVFSITRPECPEEVEVVCQTIECPPNTCKCEHDDFVCCYDKNGFPVKTIPK